MTSAMGSRRELRRCVSLVEDTQHPHSNIQPVGDTVRHRDHGATFCPVTIRVEGCSDEEGPDTGTSQQDCELSRISRLQLNQGTCSPRSVTHHNDSHSSTPSPSFPSSNNFLEVPPENSDLSAVKAAAVRLNLRTRTSSLLAWRATWLGGSPTPPKFPVPAEGEGRTERLTEERKKRINQALGWLKTELKEMQAMDQVLARQLLALRHDMHQLRLSKSCQQHQELLDDLQCQMQEQGELSDVLDLPEASLGDTPLQHLGVTRMNICARRFSTC